MTVESKTREYRTKSGKTQLMPSVALLEEMVNESQGFCLSCGEVHESIEPDARRYECDCCGAEKVYGAEELALMGLCF